jgi:hypothetical protein
MMKLVVTPGRQAFVHEAELRLPEEVDPAAVGAAVTTLLCGHCEHEGPCRWPHNNDVRPSGAAFLFRTLFVAHASEEPRVRERIEEALRSTEWAVIRSGARPVAPGERPLAARLAGAPS